MTMPTSEPSLRAQIAVVIAAYNEGPAIGEVVVGALQHAGIVVVVDDGSVDDTVALAHEAGAHVVRHPVNLGQGAALQTGIDYALKLGAQYLVTFDADGQHAASEIVPMVEHLRATGSAVV